MTKPIAITMGDPAGVGGELTISAWLAKHTSSNAFYVYDCPRRLHALARLLKVDVAIAEISQPEEAFSCFSKALPVLPITLPSLPVPGQPDPQHAEFAIQSIELAVKACMSGEAAGVVTNPVYKKSFYDAGFKYPGQTEFVGAISDPSALPLMLLAGPSLKVVPLTTHLPLSDAVKSVTSERIITVCTAMAKSLAQDFGFSPPRIAISGLNPHAGEEGKMGREEIEIIEPAINALKDRGVSVVGPLSPDSMFHNEARESYDAALCMYHDQALIPLKTLDFYSGVNITLGLPIVRTSPDHGTAFNIAGTGSVDSSSFLAAIEFAEAISGRRNATQSNAIS